MYYKIENGIIVEGPTSLDKEKSLLSDVDLVAEGYLPIEISELPVYDIYTQYLTLNKIISSDKVIHSWVINDVPSEQIPASIIERKNSLKDKLASIRYTVETSGLTINGIAIRTDRDSQSTISCTLDYLGLMPLEDITWKGANSWTTINLTNANGCAILIGHHVQTCFKNEKAIWDLIDAAQTHAALDNIDLYSNWPPNEVTI